MKKVLIVDDDRAGRQLFREVLRPLGVEFLEAGDGEEALERIRESRPDLVLLDVNLPKLDGFGVVSRLRNDSRFAAIPVVGISGESGAEDRDRALRHGFNKYLPKPVEISTLRKEIERLLDSARAADLGDGAHDDT